MDSQRTHPDPWNSSKSTIFRSWISPSLEAYWKISPPAFHLSYFPSSSCHFPYSRETTTTYFILRKGLILSVCYFFRAKQGKWIEDASSHRVRFEWWRLRYKQDPSGTTLSAVFYPNIWRGKCQNSLFSEFLDDQVSARGLCWRRDQLHGVHSNRGEQQQSVRPSCSFWESWSEQPQFT